MNIVLDPLSFNPENIFFLDKKKNNVIDGYFSKIIYSSDICTINGLFYTLQLSIIQICYKIPSYQSTHLTSYNDNKHTAYFYAHDIKNLQYISILSRIEIAIINSYKEATSSKKRNVLGLTTQLYKGYFKVYNDHSTSHINVTNKKYIVKISGVWENTEEIGLTYKFIEILGEHI